MVFLLNVLATFFMTGLIWFVQLVHYPLFAAVGQSSFVNYEVQHNNLTTYVVIVPMFIELITAVMLIWQRPSFMPLWLAWLGLALVGVIWFSTAFLQVPAHSVLTLGFNELAHRNLLQTNWLRTLAWSLRVGLLMFCLRNLLNLAKS